MGLADDTAQSIIVPHMQREVEFALPSLALLRDLADGSISEDMAPVLLLVDRFRRWLPEMFSDHRDIAMVMMDLEAAAMDDRKPEFARVVPRALLHTEMEVVIYPASLLVGQYLGLRL